MNIITIDILEDFDSKIFELNLEGYLIEGILDLSKFVNLKNLLCNNCSITQIINFPSSFGII